MIYLDTHTDKVHSYKHHYNASRCAADATIRLLIIEKCKKVIRKTKSKRNKYTR